MGNLVSMRMRREPCMVQKYKGEVDSEASEEPTNNYEYVSSNDDTYANITDLVEKDDMLRSSDQRHDKRPVSRGIIVTKLIGGRSRSTQTPTWMRIQ